MPIRGLGENKKVVIYGAGRIGCELKGLLERKNWRNIAGWVDKTEKGSAKPLDYLDTIEYDKIIIAAQLL